MKDEGAEQSVKDMLAVRFVETPTEHLHSLHRSLCDGFMDQVELVRAAIHAFAATAMLTKEEARMWQLAIMACPGHDDGGGRNWCAYCGGLPQEAGATV